MDPGQRSVYWTIVLTITTVRRDSFFGHFVLAQPAPALADTVSAPLVGTLTHGRLRIVTMHDQAHLHNIIEGVVRNDTLFVDQYRPKAGSNVLSPGHYLLLLREPVK
jgi:hypothetical protein